MTSNGVAAPLDRRPEEAWAKGQAVGLALRAADTNPHLLGSELFLDWQDGWREGTRAGNVAGAEEADLWRTWKLAH